MVVTPLLLDCLGIFLITFASALGCRFKDVGGNEWIDFMCGFGAIFAWLFEPRI